MLKIALTGPSGSGKGYISALLASMGIPTLDTDAVVHRIYDDPAFAEAVEAAVSAPVRGENGTVDRRRLAAAVFADENKMKSLLSLVYPRVREEIRAFLDAAALEGRRAAAVDAPQLFEAGFEKDFDRILCVNAPKKIRAARIVERDGVTRAQAYERMAHQRSGREYMKLSDATVRSVPGEDVRGQLESILASWGAVQ